jgi:hypothetical protein
MLVELFHMRQAEAIDKWLSHRHLVVKACQGVGSSPSVYDNTLVDGVGRVVPYAAGWDHRQVAVSSASCGQSVSGCGKPTFDV